MSNCRALWVLAVVTTLLSITSVYGTTSSLASAVAARTAKIPRSIRAPFRNNEIMTARGFGKRSQQIFGNQDGKQKTIFRINFLTKLFPK